MKPIQRRKYLKAAAGLTATTAFAGCANGGDSDGEGNTGTGYLTTEVRAGTGDIQDFEKLVLLFSEEYLKPVNGERTAITIHDTEADLVQLQGDWAKPIGSTRDRGDGGIREPLGAREYESLQLKVKEVVEATLSDGGEPTVTLPEDSLLTFNKSFEIRKEKYATFVAVVAPVKQDQARQYLLKPMTDKVEVTYKD